MLHSFGKILGISTTLIPLPPSLTSIECSMIFRSALRKISHFSEIRLCVVSALFLRRINSSNIIQICENSMQIISLASVIHHPLETWHTKFAWIRKGIRLNWYNCPSASKAVKDRKRTLQDGHLMVGAPKVWGAVHVVLRYVLFNFINPW